MYTSPTQRKSAQDRRVIRDAVADAAIIATATGVLRLDVLALELEDVPTIHWASFAEDGMSEDTILYRVHIGRRQVYGRIAIVDGRVLVQTTQMNGTRFTACADAADMVAVRELIQNRLRYAPRRPRRKDGTA